MKSLAKILGTLIVAVTLMSCTEIYFEEAQPKGVKPLENGLEELMGNYIGIDEDSDADTIIVTRDEIIFTEDETSIDELGEPLVVKKYKGYYFINFYNKEKELWQLIAAKIEDEKDLYVTNLTSLDQEDAEEILKKKYIRMIKPEDEDDYILMDPPRRKLLKLIKYPIFNNNRIHLDKIKSE